MMATDVQLQLRRLKWGADGSYLGAGGSHGPAGHLDVKPSFRVLLPPQTGVVGGLPCPLPVADGLADGLQNAVARAERKASAHCAHLLGFEHFWLADRSLLSCCWRRVPGWGPVPADSGCKAG